MEKVVSAANPSSESIEIDPGSSVKVAAFRLARVVVDELFKVRSGGGPLLKIILLQSRMVEGDAAAEVPGPV